MKRCDYIVCICGCNVCYICGRQIDGYEHFRDVNTKCGRGFNMGPDYRIEDKPLHGQVVVERVISLMPEQRRNVIACPTCGQRNLKANQNNHIKCWLCKTNFCFECRRKILGSVGVHFNGANSKMQATFG